VKLFDVILSTFSRSTHQFMTLLTATVSQVCLLRPQPGSPPPCPSDLRARLESLGIWAQGASPGRRAARQRGCWAGRRVRGRQTARVVSASNSPADLVTFACLNVRSLHNRTDDIIVPEQAEDILVPPLLRDCLTLYYVSLFWLLFPPSGTVVLVIVKTRPL